MSVVRSFQLPPWQSIDVSSIVFYGLTTFCEQQNVHGPWQYVSNNPILCHSNYENAHLSRDNSRAINPLADDECCGHQCLAVMPLQLNMGCIQLLTGSYPKEATLIRNIRC